MANGGTCRSSGINKPCPWAGPAFHTVRTNKDKETRKRAEKKRRGWRTVSVSGRRNGNMGIPFPEMGISCPLLIRRTKWTFRLLDFLEELYSTSLQTQCPKVQAFPSPALASMVKCQPGNLGTEQAMNSRPRFSIVSVPCILGISIGLVLSSGTAWGQTNTAR